MIPERFHEFLARLPLQDDGGSLSSGLVSRARRRIRERIMVTGGDRICVAVRAPHAFLAAVAGGLAEGLDVVLVDPSVLSQLEREGRRPAPVVLSDEDVDGSPGPAEREGDLPVQGTTLRRAGRIIFLTSGSTGTPKLVPKQPGQLLAQLEREVPALGLPRGLRAVLLVPPFHILGFLYGCVLPAFLGGSSRFAPAAAVSRWLQALREDRPDLVVGVPFHYRVLAEVADAPLPRALYLSSGGPLPPTVDRSFAERTGQKILQVYGSTETGGIALRQRTDPWKPLPGLEWRLVGEGGLLQVRSPWQDDPSQWTSTDDLAEPEGEGFRLIGRADSIVKIGGRRISTETLRTAALSLPGVREAVVLSYERRDETALALFLLVSPSTSTPPANALRRALADRVASPLLPRTIRVLFRFPRLANGKVDRLALRALVSRP